MWRAVLHPPMETGVALSLLLLTFVQEHSFEIFAVATAYCVTEMQEVLGC